MTRGIKVTTVHIAGPSINIDEVIIIQRCAVCGFKLYDSRNGDPILISGTFQKIGWPLGSYIREIGNRYEQLPRRPTNQEPRPKELCIDLVEQ